MINCKRGQFTLPRNAAYLNCAYMSPLLKTAEQAGIRALRRKRDPATIRPNDFFEEAEQLRTAFAKFIHASEPERVVIVPSTAYGISNAAANIPLRAGDNIVLVAEEFPSNYYPWATAATRNGASMVIVEPPDDSVGRGRQWNTRVLEAITERTKVVALGQVHWADGTLFDLAAIRRRSSEVGAALVVDGTQSVGALPFDVSVLKPDALICAAYKWLLGPYAIGLAYYGPMFDQGQPIEEHWMNRMHSENFSQLVSYQSEYRGGALRYEVGEHSSFIHVAMLNKSLQQLSRWNPASIQEYCADITRESVSELRNLGYWIEEDDQRASHLFGIRFREGDADQLKQSLVDHRVTVSIRGNAIRVSPNIYNTNADLARLTKALKHAQRKR